MLIFAIYVSIPNCRQASYMVEYIQNKTKLVRVQMTHNVIGLHSEWYIEITAQCKAEFIKRTQSSASFTCGNCLSEGEAKIWVSNFRSQLKVRGAERIFKQQAQLGRVTVELIGCHIHEF